MFYVVTMIVRMCSKYFQFNLLKFSYLTTFGLVLVGDRARTPSFIAEREFFLLNLMVGFLLGNEVTFGLVNYSTPKFVDRECSSCSDLTKSDLMVIVNVNPYHHDLNFKRNDLLLNSNAIYKVKDVCESE